MTRRPLVTAATLVLAALSCAAVGGPVDPPTGPISPTYKSLGEIEPRIAITSLPFTINTPGSYYLAASLSAPTNVGGIFINASDVTIDLNGMTLRGVAGTGKGISTATNQANITVRNGALAGWGAGGISLSSVNGAVIDHVRVYQTGSTGIAIGAGGMVSSCVVRECSGYGIYTAYYTHVSDCNAAGCLDDNIHCSSNAAVSNCQSSDSGGTGIYAGGASIVTSCLATNCSDAGIIVSSRSTVSNCNTYGNDSGGIVLGDTCTATGCSTYSQFSGPGIYAQNVCHVTNCSSSANSADGISVGSGCTVSECTACDNLFGTMAGIHVLGSGNRIDSNNVYSNNYGIRVDAADNLIVRNSARGNTSGNYSAPLGSEYGQIITNPGNGFVATNPWANFAY